MNKLILYHGSKNIVQKPTFGFGNEKTTMAWDFTVLSPLGVKLKI